MIEKTSVTITRNWDNPEIRTTINQEGISIGLAMSDFFDAVKKEFDINGFRDEIKNGIGSVTTIIKQDTFAKKFNDSFASAWFEKRLESAFKTVLKKIKEESTKVV